MRPLEEIVEAIREARSIALVSHVNPDGDTVGSALALKLGLDKLGKQTAMFCEDKVPDRILFLKGAETYRRPEEASPERFDLLVCVDVADEGRMGSCAALMARCGHIAQIDHHGTNPNYAEINCVDAQSPATALIAWEVLERLGVAVDVDMAACLYVGISTDTGDFAYNNTTPEAFRVTGDLLAAGLPLSKINRRLYRQREVAQVLLLQRALSTLTFYHNGEITSMTLTQQDFADCGALPEHADTLVNYGIDIEGVRLTVLARETCVPGEVKLSMRAVEPDSVCEVAKSFGGGGHQQASGATVCGPLAECVARCVAAFEASLEKRK